MAIIAFKCSFGSFLVDFVGVFFPMNLYLFHLHCTTMHLKPTKKKKKKKKKKTTETTVTASISNKKYNITMTLTKNNHTNKNEVWIY